MISKYDPSLFKAVGPVDPSFFSREKIIVAFVFNVPLTAKVIWRRGHGLKSHQTDW